MSDSDSSILTDSEAGLESENEEVQDIDEVENSQENDQEEEEDSENENEEDDDGSIQEAFYEDGEDDEEEEEEVSSDSSENQAHLNEEELRRINMDDFSSDDEEAGNTIGNVPLKWYEKYDHIGYDLNGEKIMRPKNQDAIDRYIHTHDKNERWTIYDEKEGKEIRLTPRQIEMIKNIQNHRYALSGYNDEPDYIPYFSGEVDVLPWSDPAPVKSRFVPSKWEELAVQKIIKGIKNGRYKPKEKKERPLYEMWENEGEERRNAPPNLMAPKLPLPTHSESYNPPAEYLPSESEKREYEALDDEEKAKRYLPQKFSCLRRVPLYPNFIKERYNRCLDLYLCPRTLKRKLNIDPNLLLPQLPNISELRPFPTTQAIEYSYHAGRVRSLQVDATGYYLASGGDDKHLIISEVTTGRVMLDLAFPAVIQEVRWNPCAQYSDVLAVVSESRVYLLDVGLSGCAEVHEASQGLLRSRRSEGKADGCKGCVWCVNDGGERFVGDENVVVLQYESPVKDMAWHHKGDYICVNASTPSASSLFVHLLSKGLTQQPLKKLGGVVQRVLFSPSSHPYLFVATQTEVRVCNLVKHTTVTKLRSGVKWISTMDIHPSGDNLILGSYDARFSWFDLDLASTPFKTLRYHKRAIRRVQFHSSYPLMSTCSDDGTIHIFHATVYNDFVHNALIVPLKVLKGHAVKDDLGVLDTDFHPSQPWIFTGGADHTIRLFINIP